MVEDLDGNDLAADDVAAEPRGVQSIDRALAVLELLSAATSPLGVTDIATTTGLPPATAHRLLRTLQRRGYVQHVAARKYAVGTAAIRLGVGAQRSVAVGAQPHLARLVSVTGETANLAVLEGDFVVYVAQASSPHMLRMFAEVGRRVLPHSTAVGKVLLAEEPEERVLALLRRTGLPRRTERTITSVESFVAELRLTRERGYAVDNGEEDLGVRCLAMPVRDSHAVVAAISVSGPGERLGHGYVNQLIEPVYTAAAAITKELRG